MDTNEKMRNLDEDYIIAFRNILKEAEKMEREAMDRFHSWSNGMMDPAEDEVYTNAVRECAGRLRKESAQQITRYINRYVLWDRMGGMIINNEKESQSKERYRYKDPQNVYDGWND